MFRESIIFLPKKRERERALKLYIGGSSLSSSGRFGRRYLQHFPPTCRYSPILPPASPPLTRRIGIQRFSPIHTKLLQHLAFFASLRSPFSTSSFFHFDYFYALMQANFSYIRYRYLRYIIIAFMLRFGNFNYVSSWISLRDHDDACFSRSRLWNLYSVTVSLVSYSIVRSCYFEHRELCIDLLVS